MYYILSHKNKLNCLLLLCNNYCISLPFKSLTQLSLWIIQILSQKLIYKIRFVEIYLLLLKKKGPTHSPLLSEIFRLLVSYDIRWPYKRSQWINFLLFSCKNIKKIMLCSIKNYDSEFQQDFRIFSVHNKKFFPSPYLLWFSRINQKSLFEYKRKTFNNKRQNLKKFAPIFLNDSSWKFFHREKMSPKSLDLLYLKYLTELWKVYYQIRISHKSINLTWPFNFSKSHQITN